MAAQLGSSSQARTLPSGTATHWSWYSNAALVAYAWSLWLVSWLHLIHIYRFLSCWQRILRVLKVSPQEQQSDSFYLWSRSGSFQVLFLKQKFSFDFGGSQLVTLFLGGSNFGGFSRLFVLQLGLRLRMVSILVWIGKLGPMAFLGVLESIARLTSTSDCHHWIWHVAQLQQQQSAVLSPAKWVCFGWTVFSCSVSITCAFDQAFLQFDLSIHVAASYQKSCSNCLSSLSACNHKISSLRTLVRDFARHWLLGAEGLSLLEWQWQGHRSLFWQLTGKHLSGHMFQEPFVVTAFEQVRTFVGAEQFTALPRWAFASVLCNPAISSLADYQQKGNVAVRHPTHEFFSLAAS